MKTLKSLLAFVLFVLICTSCGDDDPVFYDPQTQLPIDIEAIENHLTQNNLSAQEDVSGIRYDITTLTTGNLPTIDDIVNVDYELYNFDGDLLDTSIQSLAMANDILTVGRTYEPLRIVMENNQLIQGFLRAVYLLPEGSKGTFYIPSALAYQNRGSGGIIDPNENIIFVIELLSIE